MACMQEKLNEWRSKYFTKVIFRLKPSSNTQPDQPAFTVLKSDEFTVAKQLIIHNNLNTN